MARRKRKSRRPQLLIVALLALVAVVAWMKRDSLTAWFGRTLAGKTEPIDTTVAEPRAQRVSGELKGAGPARDGQLGVVANAAVLFRHVEIYQWQEHCEAGDCRYDKAWSAPVDSHKF